MVKHGDMGTCREMDKPSHCSDGCRTGHGMLVISNLHAVHQSTEEAGLDRGKQTKACPPNRCPLPRGSLCTRGANPSRAMFSDFEESKTTN